MLSEQSRRYYLQTMGIDVWIPKGSDVHCEPDEKAFNEEGLDWEQLQEKAKGCQACSLHQTRSHVVFGTGNPSADLLIIGEAPGFYEDKQAEPFVGKAGQLLNKMLLSIGLKRESVYIANVLKCRPPNNRDPKAEEILACNTWLQQQMASIQPKVILALGRHAARHLLNTEGSLASLRKQTHRLTAHDTPMIVTYHPAYLLRNPRDKAKSFQDLRKLQSLL